MTDLHARLPFAPDGEGRARPVCLVAVSQVSGIRRLFALRVPRDWLFPPRVPDKRFCRSARQTLVHVTSVGFLELWCSMSPLCIVWGCFLEHMTPRCGRVRNVTGPQGHSAQGRPESGVRRGLGRPKRLARSRPARSARIEGGRCRLNRVRNGEPMHAAARAGGVRNCHPHPTVDICALALSATSAEASRSSWTICKQKVSNDDTASRWLCRIATSSPSSRANTARARPYTCSVCVVGIAWRSNVCSRSSSVAAIFSWSPMKA